MQVYPGNLPEYDTFISFHGVILRKCGLEILQHHLASAIVKRKNGLYDCSLLNISSVYVDDLIPEEGFGFLTVGT